MSKEKIKQLEEQLETVHTGLMATIDDWRWYESYKEREKQLKQELISLLETEFERLVFDVAPTAVWNEYLDRFQTTIEKARQIWEKIKKLRSDS